MKHVVNFSGGACSFWVAYRVVERFGTANVTLLFADTLIEDEDLYAFNSWTTKVLGVPITRICEGRTPWQLFRDEGLIGNARFPICSVRLKREPLDKWISDHCLDLNEERQGQLIPDGREPVTRYLGFDWTEQHRLDAIRIEKPNLRWEAPMTEPPIWDKCKIIDECAKLGFSKQKLYELGFPHNNCGGRCVRAGISHFVHLWHVLPDRYMEWENEEQAAIADFKQRGIVPLTVLKDRRGGVTKNLSMKDLRVRILAGETFSKQDWGGCGCGGATN